MIVWLVCVLTKLILYWTGYTTPRTSCYCLDHRKTVAETREGEGGKRDCMHHIPTSKVSKHHWQTRTAEPTLCKQPLSAGKTPFLCSLLHSLNHYLFHEMSFGLAVPFLKDRFSLCWLHYPQFPGLWVAGVLTSWRQIANQIWIDVKAKCPRTSYFHSGQKTNPSPFSIHVQFLPKLGSTVAMKSDRFLFGSYLMELV